MIYSAKSIMFYLRVRVVSVVPQRVLRCLWLCFVVPCLVDVDCRAEGGVVEKGGREESNIRSSWA